MNKAKLIAGTLKWCNERRAEKNMKPLKELPKGIPCDPESCPCGTATGLSVGTTRYWKDADQSGRGVKVPDVVGSFTHEFDRGRIPELILPGREDCVYPWSD